MDVAWGGCAFYVISWSGTGLEEGVCLVLVTNGAWQCFGRVLGINLREKFGKNVTLPSEAWRVSPGHTRSPVCPHQVGSAARDNKLNEGDEKD